MVKKTVWLGMVVSMTALSAFGCKPKYPSCKKDAHCHEGEYCVNNQCQQCRDTGDCGSGQECVEGACRDIPGYCTSASDCADGQICRDNRCGPCAANGDCAEGLVCLEGACRKAECMTEEDCPAGLTCVGYRCKEVQKVEPPDTVDCELEPLYFDFDSSDMSAELRNTLERNYDCYQKRGGGTVRVEGHCDPRGTTEYNLGLGERRARIVSKALNTLGLEQSKMSVVSKGEEEAVGTDEAGWARDRKVVFKQP
jgi:peptidoglycan-associated lipoprotein